MRNLFRHIAIDLNWFISWSIIATAAHVALFWVAMPITWSINTFADLPFQFPEESSLLIVGVQVFLFWLILRVPGLVEFFYDIELALVALLSTNCIRSKRPMRTCRALLMLKVSSCRVSSGV